MGGNPITAAISLELLAFSNLRTNSSVEFRALVARRGGFGRDGLGQLDLAQGGLVGHVVTFHHMWIRKTRPCIKDRVAPRFSQHKPAFRRKDARPLSQQRAAADLLSAQRKLVDGAADLAHVPRKRLAQLDLAVLVHQHQ